MRLKVTCSTHVFQNDDRLSGRCSLVSNRSTTMVPGLLSGSVGRYDVKDTFDLVHVLAKWRLGTV